MAWRTTNMQWFDSHNLSYWGPCDLGTSWGPHVERNGERPARRRTSCTPRTGTTPGSDQRKRVTAIYWGSSGRRFKSCQPDRYQCSSEAILAHRTAGLNDRPTLSHVSCAGQTVCWRADTPPALVVTTAATALAQPTVTRALKTLNRGGIVVRDRHIDGEQIELVELTATAARGAEECLPTAAGSAFPG
jgi:DNA-binding transcriptional ArsR family regulator